MRSEFRFVIDGVDLSDEQKKIIGTAIQQAGLTALRTVNAKLESPVMVGHLIPELRPEWYGLLIGDGKFGRELAERINDIGFYAR
ncbi:MAG TPA: hypothetical protein VFX60_18915 [Micromonospora sp.]|nr:hypothetical protein [Micromonospora sp.]